MHPVEQYLSDMGAIRTTQAGTGETSYYTALSTLLNEIGSTLNPNVRCVVQLQNKGAGMPDGGMLVTNYRAFTLIGRTPWGEAATEGGTQ